MAWVVSARLPELDIEQWGIREVSQTLNVEDLLDLGPTLYEWFHWFGLNIELWPVVKEHQQITQTDFQTPPTESSAHTALQSQYSPSFLCKVAL